MSTTNRNKINQASFITDFEKNSYIKIVLKQVLYDVAKNPSEYTIKKNIEIKYSHLALKEIAYIISTSIYDLLFEKFNTEITSIENTNSTLKLIIEENISKLQKDIFYQTSDYETIDENLKNFYTYKKVSKDPIIQFIYWSITNISRLCINPKKDNLDYDITVILTDYINNVFFAINEFNKSSKKLRTSEIRNYLSSVFIDKILMSEYYQKTFS